MEKTGGKLKDVDVRKAVRKVIDKRNMRNNEKSIFLRLPENEHTRFKRFAVFNQISMKDLIRRSVKYYIEACKAERDKIET